MLEFFFFFFFLFLFLFWGVMIIIISTTTYSPLLKPQTLTFSLPLSLSNLEMVPKTPNIHLPNPSRKHTSSRHQQFRRLQTDAHRPSIRRHRSSDTLHVPRSNFLHAGFHHRLVAVGRELFEKAQSRGPDVGESGHEDIFAHV